MNRRIAALALLVSLPATALLRPDIDEPEPLSFADGGELAPTKSHVRAAREVSRVLERRHYRDQRIDDALSKRILARYIDFLDPRREIFLASDVNEFQRFATVLDEGLKQGELEPPFEIFLRYIERLRAKHAYLATFLAGDLDAIDHEDGESIQLDRSEAPWAGGETELAELWRQRAEGEVLSLVMAEKATDEIHDLLEKRYASQLRFTERFNADDVFQLFLNAVAASYDPHTQYLGRRNAETFDIEMSLSVEGIGALLGNTGEYVSIQRVIPGGPAAKDGRLEATDRIVSVAQGEDEAVDIIGWRTDEAVDLIRGAAGSVVRLQVIKENQPAGSPPKEIILVREAVSLDERAATSKVVEVRNRPDIESPRRFGVIELPDFYMDFTGYQNGDPNYRSTSRDVAREIVKLTQAGIEGLVIDLRGNGGGSLVEVTQLGGLLFGKKPVVQVQGIDPEERADVLRSELDQIYDGPLLILVDRASASASEILAGAVQDFGRGLVVGERTFGKGTVQGILPMSSGELLMTQAKFYRVTGASTQLRGVTPDMRFPDGFDETSYGEETYDEALPWDEIEPAVDLLTTIDGVERMTRGRRDLLAVVPSLVERHTQRVADEPEFRRLADRLSYFEEIASDDTLSLDRSKREAEQEEHEARLLAIENAFRAATGEQLLASLDDLDASEDADEAEEPVDEEPAAEEEAAADEPGPFQLEAARILADYVDLTRPR